MTIVNYDTPSSNMSGYFYPCVLNYCDSVSQYFGIITTPY